MYYKIWLISQGFIHHPKREKEEKRERREKEREVMGGSGGEYFVVVQGISNNYLRALDEIM